MRPYERVCWKRGFSYLSLHPDSDLLFCLPFFYLCPFYIVEWIALWVTFYIYMATSHSHFLMQMQIPLVLSCNSFITTSVSVYPMYVCICIMYWEFTCPLSCLTYRLHLDQHKKLQGFSQLTITRRQKTEWKQVGSTVYTVLLYYVVIRNTRTC